MKTGSWASILGIYLFGVCGASTVSKIIPLGGDLAHWFDLGPAHFGWLVSLIAVPAALLAIPSGMVVDRFGPRIVLLCCALLGITANVIYSFAPTMLMLQVARLLEGTVIVHMYTAGPALLMATTEGKRRTTAMTIWATYMPVGTAVGLTIGGLFAETQGWRLTFACHGALYLAAGLLGLLQPDVKVRHPSAKPGLAAQILDLRAAYARRGLLLLGLAFFLMISMGLGANVTFPRYFSRAHDISMASASQMVAMATLVMVPGSLFAGLVLSRGLSQQMLFTLLGVVGFVVGILSFFPHLDIPVRYMVLGGWFFASGAAIAVLLATLPVVAEPQRRGAATALINQAGALATFVNPPIWLTYAEGTDWTPFAVLLGTGWSIAIAAMWLLALNAAKNRIAAPSA